MPTQYRFKKGETYEITPPVGHVYRAGKAKSFPALCLGIVPFTSRLEAYAFRYLEGDREGREFLIPITKGHEND